MVGANRLLALIFYLLYRYVQGIDKLSQRISVFPKRKNYYLYYQHYLNVWFVLSL